MTWEIILGLITIFGALISLMTLVVRVNRTLVSLEEAVKQLRDFMARQTGTNDEFSRSLHECDKRISSLELSKGGR